MTASEYASSRLPAPAEYAITVTPSVNIDYLNRCVLSVVLPGCIVIGAARRGWPIGDRVRAHCAVMATFPTVSPVADRANAAWTSASANVESM